MLVRSLLSGYSRLLAGLTLAFRRWLSGAAGNEECS